MDSFLKNVNFALDISRIVEMYWQRESKRTRRRAKAQGKDSIFSLVQLG